MPWHTRSPARTFIDCGRSAGYLQRRLLRLRAVAVYARTARRRVSWD